MPEVIAIESPSLSILATSDVIEDGFTDNTVITFPFIPFEITGIRVNSSGAVGLSSVSLFETVLIGQGQVPAAFQYLNMLNNTGIVYHPARPIQIGEFLAAYNATLGTLGVTSRGRSIAGVITGAFDLTFIVTNNSGGGNAQIYNFEIMFRPIAKAMVFDLLLNTGVSAPDAVAGVPPPPGGGL